MTIAYITLTSVFELCILMIIFMQVVMQADIIIISKPFALVKSNFFSLGIEAPYYSKILLT